MTLADLKFEFDDNEIQNWMSNFIKQCEEMNDFSAIRQVLDQAANAVVTEVKMRTPIRTGQLAKGWRKANMKVSSTEASVDIVNNVEYAPFVEYGHRTRGGSGFVEGHNMLSETMNSIEPEFYSEIERMIAEKLERLMMV